MEAVGDLLAATSDTLSTAKAIGTVGERANPPSGETVEAEFAPTFLDELRRRRPVVSALLGVGGYVMFVSRRESCGDGMTPLDAAKAWVEANADVVAGWMS